MRLIFGMIIMSVLLGCTSDTQEKTYKVLTNEQKTIADQCLDKTKTRSYSQLQIDVLENPVTNTNRVILRFDFEHFYRCDFKSVSNAFISAEEIRDGKIVRSF